ncbi:hypothetical protein EVAR_60961_1 [Eumeta japonica]|uniref:Uncharacterized protein n=1 Tax=Eumeta variegata TaxID=151549 RepID=A0A4C1XW77_EUMVA|nr:hypothetical protein EVAR_60961_1 [Eumeta japonica]
MKRSVHARKLNGRSYPAGGMRRRLSRRPLVPLFTLRRLRSCFSIKCKLIMYEKRCKQTVTYTKKKNSVCVRACVHLCANVLTYTSDFGAARLDPCELRTVVPNTYTLSERSAELHGDGYATHCDRRLRVVEVTICEHKATRLMNPITLIGREDANAICYGATTASAINIVLRDRMTLTDAGDWGPERRKT